ncbi:hypothetical protein [Candidatus Palauibacter sp.]|uniref:hypothetical protein n=1 Tax=Candidatus Palauibacter sp. TaxID=3101350 RepID=UPI003B0140C9
MTTDGELLAPVGSLLPVARFNFTVHEPVVTSSRSTFDLLGEAGVIRQMEGGAGYWMGTMTEPSVSSGLAQLGGPLSFAMRWCRRPRPGIPARGWSEWRLGI